MCSSVGNYSELLDSLKNSGRWNGFDGLSDGGGVESPRVNGQDAILMDEVSPSSRVRAGSTLFRASVENSSSFKGRSTDDKSVEELEDEDTRFDYGRGNGHSRDCALADGMSNLAKIRTESKLLVENSSSVKGKYADNVIDSAIGSGSIEEEIDYSENLSWEHSEDEDSSIGYNSGDERRIQFVKRNTSQVSKEAENESGNPLVMNSSVAFGANDWDDFEQERLEDDLGSLSLHEDRLAQHQPSVDLVDAPSIVEKESNIDVRPRSYEIQSLQNSFSEENSKKVCMEFVTGIRRKVPFVDSREIRHSDAGEDSTKQIVDEEDLTVTPLRNSIFEQSYNSLSRAFEGKDIGSEEVDGVSLLPPLVRIDSGLALETMVDKHTNSINVVGEDLTTDEVSKVLICYFLGESTAALLIFSPIVLLIFALEFRTGLELLLHSLTENCFLFANNSSLFA